MIAPRFFALALFASAVAASPPVPSALAAEQPTTEQPAAGPAEGEPDGGAPGEEAGPDRRTAKTEDFPEMFRRLEEAKPAQNAYRACPADVWDTHRPLWRRAWDMFLGDTDMKDGACDKDPLACLKSCLDRRSGNACFQSARTLQENAEEKDHASWQALFAEACALGYPAGCTNRAAGALNGGYDGDPIPDPAEPKAANCLFRSFEIACREDDPWGCTMHGMSFQYGRGTAIDKAKARSAFGKSCALSPDFVACASAKGQIAEMDAPPEKDDAPEETPAPETARPDAR